MIGPDANICGYWKANWMNQFGMLPGTFRAVSSLGIAKFPN
jgi:hypothetical protein